MLHCYYTFYSCKKLYLWNFWRCYSFCVGRENHSWNSFLCLWSERFLLVWVKKKKMLRFLFCTLIFFFLPENVSVYFPIASWPLMLSEKLVKQAVKFGLFMMYTCLSASFTKCCSVSCQPWDLLRMDSLTDRMTGSCQAWSIELAQSICPWLTEGELWWHTERANY